MQTANRGSRIGRGSAYVAIVIAALAGYFVYQTWFNPSRVVKRRLGEIAGLLSVPENEAEIDRAARLSRLRSYLANDVQVETGSRILTTSGTIAGILSSVRPPKGGLDIQFVDVQVAIDSPTEAHAGLMLELNTHSPRTGEWVAEQHETIASLEKHNGEWVVVKARIRSR